MKNKIIKLDKSISNKIAAGEVVERPLNVVKELVENAIDAGATNIVVEIRKAGLSYIRVTDNGSGIDSEDLELAFTRHATSKIKSINDVYNIHSLGFRGEALASIASVSNIEIVSQTEDAVGRKLSMSGGMIKENVSISATKGTTLIVKDLFFNTPARLKFLKSNKAEQSSIHDIMIKLALSHPEIAFKFIIDNENIFITPGNDNLYDVILNIYPKEIYKNIIPFDYEENNIHISGFTSTMDISRGNSKYLINFVNNRYVKNKDIDEVIRTVYKTIIPHNRFPITFINITLDPSLIDVNIHPNKTEIRFHQVGVIKDLVYRILKKEINDYNFIPKKSLKTDYMDESFVKKIPKQKVESVKEETIIQKTEEKKDYFNESTDSIKAKIVEETKDMEAFFESLDDDIKEKKKNLNKNISNNFNKTQEYDKIEVGSKILKESFENNLVREEEYIKDEISIPKMIEETSIYDNLQYVGQVFNTFLIFEKNNEMYMIDQHAAHEKIMYERFLEDFRNSNVSSQVILEPIVIEVKKGYLEYILEHKDSFQSLGFNIEAFGDKTIIIREIPVIFSIATSEILIKDLIDNLDIKMPNKQFLLYLDNIATMSCKAAIKANMNLTYMEVNDLISSLKVLNEPYTCPHGRPIIIKMTRIDIERKFNRT